MKKENAILLKNKKILSIDYLSAKVKKETEENDDEYLIRETELGLKDKTRISVDDNFWISLSKKTLFL